MKLFEQRLRSRGQVKPRCLVALGAQSLPAAPGRWCPHVAATVSSSRRAGPTVGLSEPEKPTVRLWRSRVTRYACTLRTSVCKFSARILCLCSSRVAQTSLWDVCESSARTGRGNRRVRSTAVASREGGWRRGLDRPRASLPQNTSSPGVSKPPRS